MIWCRREPADLGLSNYFHHFFGEGVPFAYDLDHIGRYTREHERVMRHWRAVLDLPLLEEKAKSTLTPVVISNMDEIKELIKLSGSVTVGETPVIRIKK